MKPADKGEPHLKLFAEEFSHLLLEDITQNIAWQQNRIKVFGKEHLEPRLTAWFGPAYKYSSIQWPATEMPDFLKRIAEQVSKLADFSFNAALLNFYRDGQDSMGWHADDEPEIDQACIASLSLGATRKFKFRGKNDHQQQKEYWLEHGTLLLMYDFQRQWQHAVPKTKKVDLPRLNITFRRINS